MHLCVYVITYLFIYLMHEPLNPVYKRARRWKILSLPIYVKTFEPGLRIDYIIKCK